MRLCVLMSTYNGMKYIKEQLDSIFGQEAENVEIHVLIRDDGSTDNTVAFCRDYATQNNVAISIIEGNNIGPSASFLHLIQDCGEFDYYAFCDQDDVWLEGKVRAAISALSKISGSALWVSNYDVTDSELNVIEKGALEQPETDQLKALFYNNTPGCTMILNKDLLLELRKLKLDDFRMHDILTLCVSLISGKVIFDNTSYIYYRQHSANAVGKYSKKIKPIKWIKDKFRIVISDYSFNYTSFAQKVLETYDDLLDNKIKEEYILVSNYKKGLNRLRLLKKPYTQGNGGRTSKSIRMRILIGKV